MSYHVMVLLSAIRSPQFLGIMWRMRKQSIPGPLFEEERPGIEASLNVGWA